MNITLNNTPYRYNQYNNQRKVNFTANPTATAIEVAGDVGEKLASNSSNFFKPFTKMFDKISDFLCQTVAKPMLGSKWFGGFAEKVQKAGDNLFKHCMTTGAIITSGIYMQRTLANKDMDSDRKKTLAVNQLLTLIVSTAGAYLLDGSLGTWWNNVSAKFVGYEVMDENLGKDFKDVNKAIDKINKALKRNPDTDVEAMLKGAKQVHNMTDAGHEFLTETVKKVMKEAAEDGEKFKKVDPIKLDRFVEKLVKKGRLSAISEKLAKQMKGIGYLKTMIAFGFVYRYLVPVAVTKPANKLCDMYLEHKKAKQAEKTQKA